MKHLAWTLLICSSTTAQQWERVGGIELNHVESNGTRHFSQVICWRWSSEYRRNEIVAWWSVQAIDDMPRRVGDRYFATRGGTVFYSPSFTVSHGDDEELKARKLMKTGDRVKWK